MDYKDFINEIKLKLEPALGKEHSVLLHKVPKSNIGLKDAICIMDGNDPTIQVIYLDQLYNQYKNGCSIGAVSYTHLDVYKRQVLNKDSLSWL